MDMDREPEEELALLELFLSVKVYSGIYLVLILIQQIYFCITLSQFIKTSCCNFYNQRKIKERSNQWQNYQIYKILRY